MENQTQSGAKVAVVGSVRSRVFERGFEEWKSRQEAREAHRARVEAEKKELCARVDELTVRESGVLELARFVYLDNPEDAQAKAGLREATTKYFRARKLAEEMVKEERLSTLKPQRQSSQEKSTPKKPTMKPYRELTKAEKKAILARKGGATGNPENGTPATYKAKKREKARKDAELRRKMSGSTSKVEGGRGGSKKSRAARRKRVAREGR